ncbi:hypothetical protein PAECIP111894_04947 [Paenibacillus pseudetheri]|uniref:DUF2264 domain-containing protein n=2 Tax=Paenibacillus pseudetheri TaxID=2897682 RepID=A0ABM9BI42_9BACL|nr:hypothetical protein PAECIP111894_04947 [Paenibacillus pseudetheri]
MASTAWGTSGIKDLLGCRKGELVWPNANTNLLHPRTVLPMLTTTLEPGIHWLASAVYGCPSEGALDIQADQAGEVLKHSPEQDLKVKFSEGTTLTIVTHSGREIVLNLQ